MTRIRRNIPSGHVLVVDTNALWHDDKTLVVSPKFQTFWEQYSNDFKLKLVIPEVVRGELLYQQTASALTSLERANNQFKTLSGIMGSSCNHRVTPERVQRDVQRRFDRWAIKNNATIEPTPIGSIHWSRLIENAVWRKPPFIEEKDREKGFRDSLILETLCTYGTKNPSVDLAFVSGDRLIRETAAKRLSNNDKSTVYESTEEFSSYLRLTREELTAEFVRAIKHRARAKFNDPVRNKGLIVDSNLVNKIQEVFSDKFKVPAPSSGFQGLIGLGQSEAWQSDSEQGIWVGGARFDRLEDPSVYHWISPVVFVELFHKNYSQSGALALLARPPRTESLRILNFDVHWQAKVKTDGRFQRLNVSKFSFEEESFDAPTPQQIDNFQIRRKSEN